VDMEYLDIGAIATVLSKSYGILFIVVSFSMEVYSSLFHDSFILLRWHQLQRRISFYY